MVTEGKKRAVSLGIRVGFIFLLAVILVIGVSYYVLSRNVHNLLTEYTIKLVQAMTDQGVDMVEFELENGRKQVAQLAEAFQVPVSEEQDVVFPEQLSDPRILRMVYVSKTRIVASDGSARAIRERRDILAAFAGETSLYGPYFTEEQEFVIGYSAPVRRDGDIVGVLSVEKDGYRFCELIEHIRFVNSGESYIINEEGTDIAVSDRNHINWVTEQYNAQKLLETQEDPVTRAILELERNGLEGRAGVGTYPWEGSLCYVVYAPIPSVHWVLLAGLREEEIAAMTQSALVSSLSKGPALRVCLLVFFGLTGLIVFWIISSMKKNAEINEKLEIIANHDPLTGLLNRRFLESNLSEVWKYPIRIAGQAAVFMMDIDNFKKYNDYYGHPEGDDCLRRVSTVFKNAFADLDGNVMRYGGEEFMAVIFLMDRRQALEQGQKICRLVENERLPDSDGGVVTVSVGICHVHTTLDATLAECIRIADEALYRAKKSGKNKAVLLSSQAGASSVEGLVKPEERHHSGGRSADV